MEFGPLLLRDNSIHNLKFLQDFWAHDVAVSPEQAALVLVHVEAHPGIRLRDLLAAHPALSVDVVWTLLAMRHVCTDLTRTPLMRHDQVSSRSGAHHGWHPSSSSAQQSSPSSPSRAGGLSPAPRPGHARPRGPAASSLCARERGVARARGRGARQRGAQATRGKGRCRVGREVAHPGPSPDPD